MIDSILADMTSVGTVAIAAFGAVFCLMQAEHRRVNRSFALFLASIAVNNLTSAFTQVLEVMPRGYASALEIITWPSSFAMAPLFWFYVYRLTSPEHRNPRRAVRHFMLTGASVVLAIVVLASPLSLREALFVDATDITSEYGITIVVLIGVLQLFTLPQIAIYLIFIVRRLSKYRVKLRDYYSSTEKYELGWVYVIGGLGFSFWGAMALLLVDALRRDEISQAINHLSSLVSFLLVSAITLWGIRQSLPVMPNDEGAAAGGTPVASPKYEKSALSPEVANRLSRKLRDAMETDNLHRDANLSLWELAKHTGASSNYISQTLNDVIGETFFDFVNKYRIAEAKRLLATTDETVLNITYDVGFNARSSFYKAFKRHTGQTPTNYRKNLSQPKGMDDTAVLVGDV